MKRKQKGNLLLLVLLFSFFTELWIGKIYNISRMMRLTQDTVGKEEFRAQEMGETMLSYLIGKENRGSLAGLYLLETKFGKQSFSYPYTEKCFWILKEKWAEKEEWNLYLKINQAVWNDVKYFPVPSSISDKSVKTEFVNSWMNERTYGGKRGHEGTDIMASENIRGLYPVVSMTDGIVENKGWLEKGGYRIGIKAPSGGYFYYAHLDSYADLEEGDAVHAGDIIGFMGDTGYGKEGTKGRFPVHLHIGIYVYPDGKEVSINPYWVLRYLENYRLKCAYSG